MTATKTKTKTPSYDVEALRDTYPSLRRLASPLNPSSKAWVAAFTHKPEALEAMLSDLIKHAYAKPGRIGQRPMPKEEEVNLEALINGDYTEDPIQTALPKLVKISERAFCTKLHISRRMYQRMFLPENHPDRYYPDAELLQRIAKAVGKPPSYFLEYRLIAAQAAFVKLITERPAVATKLYRDYIEVAQISPVGG
jgi:transcriptional regulator with XRE-family HTH domain